MYDNKHFNSEVIARLSEVKYSKNFQLPFKSCIPTHDFCLLIYVLWKYHHSKAMGSEGDGWSGSRTFCLLEEADLNVTFSCMLLSLIGIWKLCSLSLGREKVQFKLLLMILPTFFFFFSFFRMQRSKEIFKESTFVMYQLPSCIFPSVLWAQNDGINNLIF